MLKKNERSWRTLTTAVPQPQESIVSQLQEANTFLPPKAAVSQQQGTTVSQPLETALHQQIETAAYGLGSSGGSLVREIIRIGRFVFRTRVRVEKELKHWRQVAGQAPDLSLKEQAWRSLNLKSFHALGGNIFATRYPEWETVLIPLIVALQTISDYLDNLCDRMQLENLDPAAFRQLHEAFLDALNPAEPLKNYYAAYPFQADGGYLAELVAFTQQRVRLLPAYPLVQEAIRELASLYADLQVYKHMDLENREAGLKQWAAKKNQNFPELYWWEFSAACGSTLAIFALLTAATRPGLTSLETKSILKAYFPWICGLHILLDYLIDQQEDRLGGDLNFVSYYADAHAAEQRLGWFVAQSLTSARCLPDARFHTTIVQGLPALYLSDPKVKQQNLTLTANRLLHAAGRGSGNLYQICRFLRGRKLI